MKLKIFLITGIYILVLTTIAGTILTDKWYNYDVKKCDSIKDNDYYNQNSCYTTYNFPLGTKILMFILMTLIPYILSIILILTGLKIIEII